jgi:hypothetical protein
MTDPILLDRVMYTEAEAARLFNVAAATRTDGSKARPDGPAGTTSPWSGRKPREGFLWTRWEVTSGT